VFSRFVGSLPSFIAVPGSNNLFNRTRGDSAPRFNVRGPRRLKERYAYI